jgi:peptide chain release factor subunit 1
MQSERFRELSTTKGPIVSLYFDDSHDTEDAVHQAELRWRALREELERQDIQDIDAELVGELDRAVNDVAPPVGRRGRGVIAGADGVLLNEHLARPPATPVARVSALPYIVPLVELGYEHLTYLVATVDHTGGDITVRHHRAIRSETVDGGHYPVHKASSAESAGYGDPQRRAEEQRQQNIRAVADRLTALFDDAGADFVFVIGEVQSRSDLAAALPKRVAGRVIELHVGARGSGIDDDDVRQAIDNEFEELRRALLADVAERFRAQLGTGLAVEGIRDVCSALRQGAVDTLLIGDLGDATVVDDDDLVNVSPDADALSELGASPTRVLRADEALPMLAVSTDASLVRADFEPAEGVAALLRFAPTGE